MSKNKKIVILILIGLASCLIDLFIGSGDLRIGDITNLSNLEKTILFKIRMPEMLTAAIIGLSLGLAGAIMQTILDNPLASPFTLGVSSASGFGAALFISLGLSLSLIPLGAVGFALLSISFVYIITKKNRVDTGAMILAGIAIKFFFDSLTSLVQYLSTDETLASIVFWLFGSVSNTTYKEILILSLVFLLIFILVIKDAHKLTALRFGEARARSLGVDVSRLKVKSFLLVSIISSLSVSIAGVIGFIGLIAPHIGRKVLGEDQRYYLIASSLLGAILLIFSSILSKLIKPGVIMPIGIISSLIGLPLIFIFFFGAYHDRS